MWVSELLPHTATVAKELCVVHSTFTEAINHDPAITYIQTGSQIPGRPSLGAWLSYGLGSMNENLPHYVVMHATHQLRRAKPVQSPVGNRIPALGPSGHPAAQPGRSGAVSEQSRRRLRRGSPRAARRAGRPQPASSTSDSPIPEILARIRQHEMAYRMQTSVPELMDLSAGERRDVSSCTAKKRASRARLPPAA